MADVIQANKTMIKLIFFLNLIFYVISFFKSISLKTCVLITVILSGLIYMINKSENKVEPLIKAQKYPNKINNLIEN